MSRFKLNTYLICIAMAMASIATPTHGNLILAYLFIYLFSRFFLFIYFRLLIYLLPIYLFSSYLLIYLLIYLHLMAYGHTPPVVVVYVYLSLICVMYIRSKRTHVYKTIVLLIHRNSRFIYHNHSWWRHTNPCTNTSLSPVSVVKLFTILGISIPLLLSMQ